MIVQIKALMIKELLAIWRDKKSRFVLIFPPIIQLLLFAFAVTLEVKNISLAIFNQDSGKDSYEIIQRFVGSPQFTNIKFLKSEEEIDRVMDEGEALITLQFPQDFSRNVRKKGQATLQAILDGRQSNSSFIVLGYVTEIVNNYNQELMNYFNEIPTPANVVVRHWFNPNLIYTWYTIPSLVAILGTVIALVLSSLSIAREREMGTFEQLLVSPLTPTRIIIGKIIPALVLALMESSIILAFAIFAFGIPFEGNIFYLYGSMIIFLFSILGIGLFISSLCSTQQQAVLGTFIFMSPSMMISGFATPVENMPVYLQYIAQAIPITHFLVVVRGVFLKGITASMVWAHTWPNIIIAFFTLSIAVWFFRHRLE